MGTRLPAFFTNYGYLALFSLCLSQLVWCAVQRDTPTPTPLSLPPSQYWYVCLFGTPTACRTKVDRTLVLTLDSGTAMTVLGHPLACW